MGVENFDVSPDGSRLIVIGNFRQADGLVRDQAMMVLLEPTRAVVDLNWKTTSFESVCNSKSFDSWVRDVQFSPDGSYFVVVTTGGPNTGTLCDSASRWDTAATGQTITPRWVAYTGGDTLFSVAVTGSAVYVGGHQRWMNNTNGPGLAPAGAVPRPGIAALDPRTGIPLSWNPGRNPRGVGAEALLATSTGLYVGMDTDYIGNRQYLRPRLAFFPLAGGTALPDENTGALPTNVYLAGRQTATTGAGINDVRARFYTGNTVGTDAAVDGAAVEWSRARGAFMAGNTLFYGYPNSAGAYYLYRRTFDGVTFGPATAIDPYNDPFWSTIATGSAAQQPADPLPRCAAVLLQPAQLGDRDVLPRTAACTTPAAGRPACTTGSSRSTAASSAPSSTASRRRASTTSPAPSSPPTASTGPPTPPVSSAGSPWSTARPAAPRPPHRPAPRPAGATGGAGHCSSARRRTRRRRRRSPRRAPAARARSTRRAPPTPTARSRPTPGTSGTGPPPPG